MLLLQSPDFIYKDLVLNVSSEVNVSIWDVSTPKDTTYGYRRKKKKCPIPSTYNKEKFYCSLTDTVPQCLERSGRSLFFYLASSKWRSIWRTVSVERTVERQTSSLTSVLEIFSFSGLSNFFFRSLSLVKFVYMLLLTIWQTCIHRYVL